MYTYCTSAIPRRLNCIGKNQKQVQHFKPLKHNQKNKKQELKITNLLPNNKANQKSVIKMINQDRGSPIKSWKNYSQILAHHSCSGDMKHMFITVMSFKQLCSSSQLWFLLQSALHVIESIFLVEKPSSSLTLWTSRHIEKKQKKKKMGKVKKGEKELADGTKSNLCPVAL